MRGSLDELYRFIQNNDYDIYFTEDEKAELKGIPKAWREQKFIKRRLLNEHGFCYPLINAPREMAYTIRKYSDITELTAPCFELPESPRRFS